MYGILGHQRIPIQTEKGTTMIDFDEVALKLAKAEADNKVLRKALAIAVDAMKISNEIVYSAYGSPLKTLKEALEQITALEQKD